MADEEFKKPEEWCEILGAEILDPDGWDRTNFEESWNTPIAKGEFDRRYMACTVNMRKYIPPQYQRFAPPRD